MEKKKQLERLKTFSHLKHGDRIISPIDNVVTEFYISKDGTKYLAGKRTLYDICQFSAGDFYYYDGNGNTGDEDKEYFQGLGGALLLTQEPGNQ